jgi:hypothetical protein
VVVERQRAADVVDVQDATAKQARAQQRQACVAGDHFNEPLFAEPVEQTGERLDRDWLPVSEDGLTGRFGR